MCIVGLPMAVSFTVLKIKRDIGPKNANFSYALVFNLHDHPLEPVRFFLPKILIQTVPKSLSY